MPPFGKFLTTLMCHWWHTPNRPINSRHPSEKIAILAQLQLIHLSQKAELCTSLEAVHSTARRSDQTSPRHQTLPVETRRPLERHRLVVDGHLTAIESLGTADGGKWQAVLEHVVAMIDLGCLDFLGGVLCEKFLEMGWVLT